MEKKILAEKYILLKNLLRSIQTYSKMEQAVNQYKLFPPEVPSIYYLWSKIQAYFFQYKALPNKTQLWVEFENNLDDFKQSDAENISFFIHNFAFEDALEQKEYVKDLFNKYLTIEAKEVFKSVVNDPTMSLQSSVNQLHELFTDTTIDDPSGESMYTNYKEELDSAKRERTYIEPLDELTLGTAAGELVGIIIPSGGGKSTIGWRLAKERASRQKPTIYMSLEQPRKGDFQIRWHTITTDSHSKYWRNGWDEAPEDLKNKFLESKKIYDPYFKFFDLQNPRVQISSIKHMMSWIKDLEKYQGFSTHTLIIDWWGRLRNKMVASNQFRSEQARRFAQQEWMGELKSYSVALGLHTILFNQLQGAKARSANTRVSQNDGQEDTNWGNMCDLCIVGNKADDNYNYDLYADKFRMGAKGQVRVHLDGVKYNLTTVTNDDDVVPDETQKGSIKKGYDLEDALQNGPQSILG